MLPGVELARRRRVHYHGDVLAAGAGEHHAWQYHQLGATAQAGTGVVGPALAARIRLEEKLRGAALPSPSPSRWGRLMGVREGRATSRQQQVPDTNTELRPNSVTLEATSRQQQQQQQQQVPDTNTELRPNSVTLEATTSRAELKRTLSKADLCAVCLDEVRERHQRITRLPCSHKYHSDCVLPWLAIQPDCPCCRTLVPSVDTLS